VRWRGHLLLVAGDSSTLENPVALNGFRPQLGTERRNGTHYTSTMLWLAVDVPLRPNEFPEKPKSKR